MKMKIGELARKAGCQVVTVRFYEKKGLLPGPERSSGNYRLYGETDLDNLLFIRRCRRHGMSLDEIRALLDFCERPTQNCSWISSLIERHIANVETQIGELEHLKKHLVDLLRECSGGRGRDCGILKCLHEDAPCSICRGRGPLSDTGKCGEMAERKQFSRDEKR